MARRITGAWAQKPMRATATVPLKPGPDPEHFTPTPNPQLAGTTPLWQQSGPSVPTLPDSLTLPPFGTTVAPGGPIDHTPESHDFGVGVGHGQTVEQAQEVRAEWMSVDLGELAAHEWQPATDRDSFPQVTVIYDTPGDGDSPQTLELQRTGVGRPNDPEARTGKRIARWWWRYIDMHRYEVGTRPAVARYAYPQTDAPPVPDGMQLDSPFSTLSWLGTRNKFVQPQLRRNPIGWDQPTTAAATGQDAAAAASAQLLNTWGL